MKTFLDENFLLQTSTAQRLYHENAAGLPIIDYHCHLDPQQAAQDRQFENLSRLWLECDHYKWRLMRACGVDECFITGDSSDWEKFQHWAATIPQAMGNPMYHWTHLELKSAFGITEILSPASAQRIYERANELLQQPNYSARGLMRRYKVEAACTTDDPTDSLEHHAAMKEDGFEIKVLPTWRPDKVMNINSPAEFRKYVDRLSKRTNIIIRTYNDLVYALKSRHNYFHNMGCRLSDHGLTEFYADTYTTAEACAAFRKCYDGKPLTHSQAGKLKSALLYECAKMDYERGWTQQFHYGALRNTNSRLHATIGADAGADSIGGTTDATSMARFLDRLDSEGILPQTIIYNLNPADNAMLASMTGNFQDGKTAGKIQFGAAWWFLDHKNGIEDQLSTLAAIGLISQFVGMLTDSRSFLSYPRHDYFRRILCNYIGQQIEDGLLPFSEINYIGKMVENICYYNAKRFFNFN